MLFFGFHGAGLAHRFFGLVLLGAVVWHLANVFWRAFVRGESGIFWGPDSMVPQPRDFVHFYQAAALVLLERSATEIRALHVLGEVRLLGGSSGARR
jgi:hypothetical protein